MRISTIVYTIKQGCKNIIRNRMFSLASIGTMAACIFMFGVFFSVIWNLESIVDNVQSGVAVTVFFNENLSEEEIKQIGGDIEKRNEVESIKYTSADEAWENFKVEFFGDNVDLAEVYDDDNPLERSANYEVYLKDVSGQESLVTYLKSIEGVRQVNYSQAVADTLQNFNKLIAIVCVVVIVILVGVSIFLISNTVTIGIAVRKEEIAIMKLIGATDFFVKAPFLLEGALIGLIGAALPLLVLNYAYNSITRYLLGEFSVIKNFLDIVPADDIFSVLIPVALLMGVGIGLVGSLITTRKHLRV